jgi:hypothetical protein
VGPVAPAAVRVGVDLGQRVDFTAFAVVQAERRPVGARVATHHTCRHLERLELGTGYPKVAERLAQVAAALHARTGRTPLLFLDATGVGIPVLDALVAGRVRAVLRPCYFNHGDRMTWETAGSVVQLKVGKAWLVSRLQVLLQSRRLHLPKGHPQAETLAKELLDYQIRVDEDANDKYGAFKVGSHDDLVTALGLATLQDLAAPRPESVTVYLHGRPKGQDIPAWTREQPTDGPCASPACQWQHGGGLLCGAHLEARARLRRLGTRADPSVRRG